MLGRKEISPDPPKMINLSLTSRSKARLACRGYFGLLWVLTSTIRQLLHSLESCQSSGSIKNGNKVQLPIATYTGEEIKISLPLVAKRNRAPRKLLRGNGPTPVARRKFLRPKCEAGCIYILLSLLQPRQLQPSPDQQEKHVTSLLALPTCLGVEELEVPECRDSQPSAEFIQLDSSKSSC